MRVVTEDGTLRIHVLHFFLLIVWEIPLAVVANRRFILCTSVYTNTLYSQKRFSLYISTANQVSELISFRRERKEQFPSCTICWHNFQVAVVLYFAKGIQWDTVLRYYNVSLLLTEYPIQLKTQWFLPNNRKQILFYTNQVYTTGGFRAHVVELLRVSVSNNHNWPEF